MVDRHDGLDPSLDPGVLIYRRRSCTLQEEEVVLVEVDVLDLALVPVSVLNDHLSVTKLVDALLLVVVEERHLSSLHVAEEDGEFHCEASGGNCRHSRSHMIAR